MDRFRRGNKDDDGEDRPEDRRSSSKPPSDKPDKEEDKSGRRFGVPSLGRGGGDDKPAEPAGRRPSSGGGAPSDEGGSRRFPALGRGGENRDKDTESRSGSSGPRRPEASDGKKEEDEGGPRRFGPLGRNRPGDEEKKDDRPGDRPSSSAGGRPPLGGGDRPSGSGSPLSRPGSPQGSGDRPGASPSGPRSTGTFGANRDEGGGTSGGRTFGGGGGGSPFNREKEEKDEGGTPGGRPFGAGGGSSFGRDRDADSGGGSGRPGGDRPGMSPVSPRGTGTFGSNRDAEGSSGPSGNRPFSGGGGSPFNREADSGGGGGRPGGDRPGGGGSTFGRDREADSGGGGGRPGGDRPGGGGSSFGRDREADSGGGGGRPGGDRPGGGGSTFGRDRDAGSGGGRPGGGTSGSGSPERSSPLGGGGRPSSPGAPSSPGRPSFGGSGEGGRTSPAADSPGRSASSPPVRPGMSPSPARPGTKPPEPEADKSKRGLPGFGGRREAPPDSPKKSEAKPKEEASRRFGMPAIGRKSTPEEDKRKVDDKRRKEEPPKRATVEVKKDPKAAAKTSRATATAARLPERADTGIRNVTHGLDYNRKLDLAGYLLLGAALILGAGLLESFLSSDPKGFTFELDQFLAQFFGLGRVVIPAVSAAIGFWLVARHFGKVIEIDYFRILGFGVLFVTLLTILQWWELMWTEFPTVNEVPTIEALEAQSEALWNDGDGGGLIGHVVYMFLQRIFWDIGVPVVLVISLGLGTMFAFDLSFEKMAVNIRTTRANRQAKREAALARYAESKGLVPATTTSAPSGPAMAVAAAVMTTEEHTGPQRNVGRSIGRTAAPAPAPVATASAPVVASAPATVVSEESKSEKRGLFGRRKEDAPTDAPITAATDGDAPKRAEKAEVSGRKQAELPIDKPITADTDGDAPKRAERASLFGRKKEEAPTDKPITADTDGDAPKRAPLPGMTPIRESSERVEKQAVDRPKSEPVQPEGDDTGARRRLPGFVGRSASPESPESKDKPATLAADESEASRRRLPGLPSRRVASGDTGPIAASETTGSAARPPSAPATEESTGGRRLSGLRAPFGGRPAAESPDPAKPVAIESASKPAAVNEAVSPAEEQSGRRRFGVPSLPGRKAPETSPPAVDTGTSAGGAAAVVAGMAATEAAKQPSRLGSFGRRGPTTQESPATPTSLAQPAEKSAEAPSETTPLKPVRGDAEKSEVPAAEKPAMPTAPSRGLPDLTPAERAMLGGEVAPAEKPREEQFAAPVAEAPTAKFAPSEPAVAAPELVKPESVEPALAPEKSETLAPVRRGFPQFTAAEAAMMGVAAIASEAPKPEDAPETPSTMPGGRRPMTTPPRDLPGRQPAETGGLFARSAERTPPPSSRLSQPETRSNDDTQVVETNATQPISVPSTPPADGLPESPSKSGSEMLPRRPSPFAKPGGDGPLFRPRATNEVPAVQSSMTLDPAKPAASDAEKSDEARERERESARPATDLSANPSGVAMAGAALASELFERKPETSESPATLPQQPAQPRGIPPRSPDESSSREQPAAEGVGDETARLSHFQRAFGGDTPEGEKPQRANFAPRREPVGRALSERPVINTPPPDGPSAPTMVAPSPDNGKAEEAEAEAMAPAQPRFLRQNPFDHPEGETENIVPPIRAARPTAIGRSSPRPQQIGGANPDLDKGEITEDDEAETNATSGRAALVPFAVRREQPAVLPKEPIEEIDDDEDDDEDEVPVVATPPAARRLEPEPEPADLKPNATNHEVTSKWLRPEFLKILEEGSEQTIDQEILLERAQIIEETLESFGAPGKVVEVNTGPVITQFGVEPDYVEKRGGQRSRVKVSAIAALDRDLALALAAKSIRIEAPVPGKGFVGIEVPNAETAVVSLRDVMSSEYHERRVAKSKLVIGLGRRVDGAPVSADLTEMPHLLIAGATGSGKSVCVNAIICCLLLQNTPDELQMIMVDPKRVELAGYNGIPHLVAPVVVDLERIVGVLKWVQREMDDRYKRFATLGARNIQDYNRKRPQEQPQMPYLVVIVDELADLMMLAPDETERLVARLAQMARATGIHLIISTQRPSVDVVTGLIKANFPARIAFAVASSVDSRVIIDQPGAEKLLGRGDMLFQAPDSASPLRMQGVYLSDNEINRITSYWKSTRALKGGKGSQPDRPALSSSPLDEPAKPVGVGRRPDGTPVINDRRNLAGGQPVPPGGNGERRQDRQQTFWEEVEEAEMENDDDAMEGVDDLYDEAVKLVRERNKASISMLQRHFRIGYTRSARLIDLMEERGVVGPAESGAKPRTVIPEK